MKPVQDATPAAEGHRAPRVLGRMARAFAFVAAAVLLLMLVAVWLLGAREGLESMRALLTTAKPYLVTLHLLLIALMWIYWAQLIDWGNRLVSVPESFRGALLAARHRAALWLLAFELIVVIGLPSLLGGPHS
ncbi:MAG: hypothetical protein KDH15_06640 [Rhodocyclaceae bacterium]|nr:hypothetical protein [Rhodocyclaceae bacterium]